MNEKIDEKLTVQPDEKALKKTGEKARGGTKDKGSPAPEKVNLTTLVERTSERIVFLKKQQEELQKQKAELEILNQQRKELDAGKREIMTSLSRAIAVLNNEESEFQRKYSLVQTTRDEFKKILREIRVVREESWAPENIKEELSQALALVARAKTDYRNAQGKIEALTSRELERGGEIRLPEQRTSEIFPSSPAELFKRGLLFFLPAAILALLLILAARFIRLI